MPKFVRSARGEIIDFDLMALKAQMAATPIPSQVKQRKEAIAEKDTGRSAQTADVTDFLAMSTEAATISANSIE